MKDLRRRPRRGRQADRREAEAGGRRRELGAVSSARRSAGAGLAPACRRSIAGGPGGARRGGDGCTVLAFLSPWLVGFCDLLRLSARDDGATSRSPLRPAQPAALGRARELPLPLRDRTRRSGRRSRTRSGFIAIVRAAAGAVRVRDRGDAHAREARRRRLPDDLLPARAGPPVAATLGFVYLLNPATGPVNTLLGQLGIEGPLWFNDPGWSKPSLVAARDVGHRQHR